MPIITEKVWTIYDIKQAHRMSGGYWFDVGSMRFFKSRVGETVYQGKGGIYFISSEQFTGSQKIEPRRYTVRRFDPETGDINTVKPFNEMSRSQAISLARRCQAGEHTQV